MKLRDYLDYLKAYRNRVQYYFVRLDDWYRYSPCQTAPKIDPRSLVNCCPSSIRCPLRDSILFSLSKFEVTEENYSRLMRRYDDYRRSFGSRNIKAFFIYTPTYSDKR